MASKSCLHRVALAAAAAVAGGCLGTAARRPRRRSSPLPNSDPKCFAPWGQRHQAVPVPGEKGSVPDRPGERLRRQHLAHPDDQDGQGLRGAARRRRQAEGVKVVSTGEDVAAQIAAINNFIDSGLRRDRRQRPGTRPLQAVIKRANDAGVVLVAFDNILDTEEAINVNVDQKGLGKYWAEWLVKVRAERRQGARGARASPAPRSTATGTKASRRCSRPRARSGRRSR